MAQLAKIRLVDTEVWAEVSDRSATAQFRPADAGERVLDVTDSLNSAIRAYCTALRQSFESLKAPYRPNKINASFGLKVSGDLKFVTLAEVGAEASLTIEAEWQL